MDNLEKCSTETTEERNTRLAGYFLQLHRMLKSEIRCGLMNLQLPMLDTSDIKLWMENYKKVIQYEKVQEIIDFMEHLNNEGINKLMEE